LEKSLRGGEHAGKELLNDFIAGKSGLARYGTERNDMAADATSHLSPHLHFGTVSVRELVRRAREPGGAGRRANGKTRKNAQVWMDELVWREFFSQVLYHFPYAARRAFRLQYAELRWDGDNAAFEAWREGRTGYPLVDAGMRQLKATGWMHNRARMVTASFLTKDLLLNWQEGEDYFLRTLVDGDMASNNGGWQWAAGTGTDAQPFFRIFHPVRQSKRFDPQGEYIRRWVPELEKVPTRYIHTPWEMPEETAGAAGVKIGKEYPLPIVDHALQRERALEMYRRARTRTI
jgi:deoxyribodipyrimidine photo-lyase